jgi:hypothetical protein
VSIDSPDGLALYRRGAGIQVLEKLAPVTERFSGKWLAPSLGRRFLRTRSETSPESSVPWGLF